MQIQLPDYSKANVLVIGDVMLDRYWYGDAARISPEAPVPVVHVKQIDERPGGAGNVALNMTSLGAEVNLIGICGRDEAAEILRKQLSAAHIKHALESLEKAPTITKLRIVSRHQQLLRCDFEHKFTSFNPTNLIENYQKHLAQSQVVVLSDYNKGTLNCVTELIGLAKKAGVTVLVDPKGSNFSCYQGADIITPNYKEFETIVGTCKTEQEIVAKGQQLLRQYQIKYLLLTRGEQGMTLIHSESDEIHLPAHARQVFDVTGAGDTVIGVLAASLAAGADLPQAMMLANLAASLVVAKLGTATVSAPELEAALQGAHIPSAGIVNEEQLLAAVAAARNKGKKIVFTNGCFDILHAGHVKYLRQAKQQGDYLIVAMNDDHSVARLKGPGRPVNNVEQRMAVLAGLGMVDWVVSFADDTPERLLKKLRPEILVKGGDYTIDQVVGAPIVYAYGGVVRVLGATKNISTSNIIDRMVKKSMPVDTTHDK